MSSGNLLLQRQHRHVADPRHAFRRLCGAGGAGRALLPRAGLARLGAARALCFDMATLTGLYRAASFPGLGARLIAIVWFYQRMATPDAAV